ncbi:MAG: cytochrome P460 family protein [Sneathiella sp.]|nr:cytochrome P460 family protein [Sneathiella sp.]
MQALKNRLRYSVVIPAIVGVGILTSGSIVFASQGQGAFHPKPSSNPAAVSRTAAPSKSGDILVAAACNPCAAKKANACNPCNPCAAKNPCNPCAVKKTNACNPCAAKKANACNPCNPCAAKKANACNPCNPCAAKNPCNPCAAKNPCNPCAAKNPCNPCAASNPCNPCNPCAASAEAPELTTAQATAAYKNIQADLLAGYAKSGIPEMAGYETWVNVATSPYVAATHGNRHVNNWVNEIAAKEYMKYEEIGTMPVGSVIAKDSFSVNANGKVAAGPLFLMEKMQAGFAPKTGNWRYSLVMPTGAVFGRTNGKNSAGMTFCAECHEAGAEDQDYLLFLPDEHRK